MAPTHVQCLEVFPTHEADPCGLRWQSAVATPLWKAFANPESGVALRFPPSP